MKTILKSLLFSLAFILLSSFVFVENAAYFNFEKSKSQNNIELKKVETRNEIKEEPKNETRELSDFSKISLSISADIFITQADKIEMEIIADKETLENIITVVSSAIWIKLQRET